MLVGAVDQVIQGLGPRAELHLDFLPNFEGLIQIFLNVIGNCEDAVLLAKLDAGGAFGVLGAAGPYGFVDLQGLKQNPGTYLILVIAVGEEQEGVVEPGHLLEVVVEVEQVLGQPLAVLRADPNSTPIFFLN